jgi:aminomuconate-semialdehyde/2-hydroxymuconate-6-semialdehyde dehydrogenase
MKKIKNYIDGEFYNPISDEYIDNYDPSTGAIYSLIPDSDERDVNIAVDAASEAFKTWSVTPVSVRSKILLKIAELIEKNLEPLAKAESVDNGKPLWLAKSLDIPRAAENFHFYGTGILHFASESHAMENSALNYTLRTPIGVAGCISPWNLPLYLFTWKIVPAIATGNTVVAKPSEITPMTAYLLSKICMEAGLPPGVLNIVHGYGHKVGSAITAHPGVPVISFTGGTKTGETIATIAATMFKKLSLELGGKNPNIVFADCDLEKAVRTSVRASFTNQGEICLCGSRIFIEKAIYDSFKEKFLNETDKMTVGDPLEDNNKLGAIVSKQHFDKILHYIHLAQEEGGTILKGGKAIHPEGRCNNGWFIEPTVIENLPFDCRTNQEEIFGPVVTLTPFETEEEVLKYANSTRYGLAALVFTENLNKAHRVASKLQSGIVWVNCWLLRDLRTPFGGVKQSGMGREGGFEAFKFFTEEKNICIKF